MICSNCYYTFDKKGIEVGELFNNSPDLVTVCSDRCEKELTESVRNGTWMEYRGFPETSE